MEQTHHRPEPSEDQQKIEITSSGKRPAKTQMGHFNMIAK
jgi:hypothetical protein